MSSSRRSQIVDLSQESSEEDVPGEQGKSKPSIEEDEIVDSDSDDSALKRKTPVKKPRAKRGTSPRAKAKAAKADTAAVATSAPASGDQEGDQTYEDVVGEKTTPEQKGPKPPVARKRTPKAKVVKIEVEEEDAMDLAGNAEGMEIGEEGGMETAEQQLWLLRHIQQSNDLSHQSAAVAASVPPAAPASSNLLDDPSTQPAVEGAPTYVLEMSKSGRAKCVRCEQPIANKTPRCQVMYFRAMFSSNQHLDCTIFHPSIITAEAIDGYYSLPADVQQQVKQRLVDSPEEYRQAQEEVDPDDLVRHEWSEEAEPPATLLLPLLPYQKEGLAWMQSKENSATRGGILADEMGMGKTIQMISVMLAHRAPPRSLAAGSADAAGDMSSGAGATLTEAEAKVAALWTQGEIEHFRSEQGSIYVTDLKRSQLCSEGGSIAEAGSDKVKTEVLDMNAEVGADQPVEEKTGAAAAAAADVPAVAEVEEEEEEEEEEAGLEQPAPKKARKARAKKASPVPTAAGEVKTESCADGEEMKGSSSAGLPRRPSNPGATGWKLFLAEGVAAMQASLKEAGQSSTKADATKSLRTSWLAMDAEAQAPYDAQAAVLKSHYVAALKEHTALYGDNMEVDDKNNETPAKKSKVKTKTKKEIKEEAADAPPELVPVTVPSQLQRGGTLLVLPTVAIRQWQAEIARFTLEGSMTVQVYHGADRQTSLQKLASTDVVITSYKIVESEYRKATAGTKVTCRICERRFYPDKLRVHRKYFCGAGAQRTDAQQKTQKKRKRKSGAAGGGDEEDEDHEVIDLLDDASASESDEDISLGKEVEADSPRGSVGSKSGSSPNSFGRASSNRGPAAVSLSLSPDVSSTSTGLPSLEEVLAQQQGRVAGNSAQKAGAVINIKGKGKGKGRLTKSDGSKVNGKGKGKRNGKGKKLDEETESEFSDQDVLSDEEEEEEAAVTAIRMGAGKGADDKEKDTDWFEGKEDMERDIERALRASEKARGSSVLMSRLHHISWFRVVLDEAHNIKDRSTSTAKSVFHLMSLYKWCLSGTPLQNRVGELFSQVRFLRFDPHAYYNCKSKGCKCKSLLYRFPRGTCECCGHNAMMHYCHFNKEILNPIKRYGYVDLGKKAMGKLKRGVLDEILLRRTKQTRADDIQLPPRVVRVRREKLDENEEDFYAAIYSQSRAQFSTYVKSGTVLNNYANIFEVLMRLRQAIDHPYLVIHSRTQHDAGLRAISSANMQRRKEERQEQLVAELAETCCLLCKDPVEDARRATCGCIFCCTCITEYIETITTDANAAYFAAAAAMKEDNKKVNKASSSSSKTSKAKKNARQVTTCPGCSEALSVDMDQVLDLEQLEAQLAGSGRAGRPTGGSSSSGDGSSAVTAPAPGSSLSSYAAEPLALLTSLQQRGRRRKSILDKVDLSEFRSSTKVEALMQELHEMQARDLGAKAIVFSQFTSMLDIIEHRISSDRYSSGYDTTHSNSKMSGSNAPPLRCAMLMGNMSIDQRDRIVKDFNNDESLKVLLISLKAGGVALNLTVASHIFIMDPWWNPAAEMQAIDRTHRFGQHKPIFATRFIMEGTIEERILRLQEKKRLVFDGTIGGDTQSMGRLTAEDMGFLFS